MGSTGSDDVVLQYFLEAAGSALGGLPRGIMTQAGSAMDDGGSTAGNIAKTVLKNAFGMMPLVRGLMSLFGGGGHEDPPPLVKYELPQSVSVEQALAGGEIGDVAYGTGGLPRFAEMTSAEGAQPATMRADAAGSGGNAALSVGPGRQQVIPSITVQVQAMDARSFLDHSNDIAQAVREAMLNSHPLNDVVSEI